MRDIRNIPVIGTNSNKISNMFKFFIKKKFPLMVNCNNTFIDAFKWKSIPLPETREGHGKEMIRTSRCINTIFSKYLALPMATFPYIFIIDWYFCLYIAEEMIYIMMINHSPDKCLFVILVTYKHYSYPRLELGSRY